MRFPLFLFLLAPLFATAYAADPNGYSARFECRSGGPVCNLDIANVAAKPCDQIISSSTSPTNNWNAIDWSNSVICIAPGDHTARGTLTIGASGSPGSFKVLRYYRDGDNDDEPWSQLSQDRARLSALDTNAERYWIIHRVSFQDSPGGPQLNIRDSSNIIVSRSYFSNMDNSAIAIVGSRTSADSNSVQNSVIQDGQHKRNFDVIGIDICNSTNSRIVNNEIRNPGSHHIQISECGLGAQGTVVENNDLYFSSAVYTNCGGSFTASGPCAAGEAILSFKDSGTSANPVRVIHNRIWGARVNDLNVCCTGASGSAISPVGGGATDSRWYLFQNNIVADSQNAFEWTTWGGGSVFNHSVVGNLIYDIQPFHSSTTSAAFWWGGLGAVNNTEFYFNTIVDAASLFSLGKLSNLDFRSNVTINVASSGNAPTGSGTESINNAYFNSAAFSTSGASGDIVRNTAAESGNTRYCYWRKLRTLPENVCVQNAKPTSASPYFRAADPTTGQRRGIGINDVPTL